MRVSTTFVLTVALAGCRGPYLDSGDSGPFDELDDTGTSTEELDLDGDGFAAPEDCDDNDATVFPGADELCNNIDDNCDGEIDNDPIDARVFTKDEDGDGVGGIDAETVEACEAPEGFVEDVGDCDDTRDDVYPGAEETDCTDATDYNCDGSVGYDDRDEDGFAACEECDDFNASVNPDAAEVPYDGIDNDCDPMTPDDDLDGDGFTRDVDCDDTDPLVHPDAAEVPYDGIDNDCDPSTADDDLDGDGYGQASDCDDTNPVVSPGATEIPYDGIDNDCDPATRDDDVDGDSYVGAEDCNDNNADINPGATEIPYDGIDNDCDPMTPDDDLDGDGFTRDVDCDDTDPLVHPDAAEVPYDGIDNDCDPSTKDDDLDGDGFPRQVDCDDTDPAVHPSADEIPYDGIDNDCRASTPDDDLDGDGHVLADDCDDTDPLTYPGAPEIWYDGVDQACDGGDDYDQDGDGHRAVVGGGDDCLDTDASVQGCGLTPESALESCRATNEVVSGLPDGTYWINPTGSDPFEVTCDMTTDGGGWTVIKYAADLPLANHGGTSGSDFYAYHNSDFTTELSTERILAIQAVSTEGYQQYVGICDHVIHYDYQDGNYAYAAGFKFVNGEETSWASSSYLPYDITVDPAKDHCEANDDVDRSTTFEIRSVAVPVANIFLRDVAHSNERYGSKLTQYPARLR